MTSEKASTGGALPLAPTRWGHLPKCVHFNGIQHTACKAGVAYLSVRDNAARPYRWPCIETSVGPAATTCAQYRALTAEEWAEIDRVFDEAIDRANQRMTAGQCIHCGTAVTGKRIIGRCLYVEPCGHRQGQVDSAPDDTAGGPQP